MGSASLAKDKLASAAIKDAVSSRGARPRLPEAGQLIGVRAECCLDSLPLSRPDRDKRRGEQDLEVVPALGRSSETRLCPASPRPELGSDSCELYISEQSNSDTQPLYRTRVFYKAGVEDWTCHISCARARSARMSFDCARRVGRVGSSRSRTPRSERRRMCTPLTHIQSEYNDSP